MVKIKLKKTSTPGKMPNQSSSAIEVGELLMNIASASTADNFLTTLKANGKSGSTSDYIKWSDDETNNKKFASKTDFDTLVENIEDNELVIATALNQLNESAGFSEGGLSVLPNQQSLTEAIQDLQANLTPATTSVTGVSKLVTGDLKNKTYTAGQAAAAAHTHGNYSVTSHTHSNYSLTSHTHSNYSVTGHSHDDKYYTESEMNTKLAAKSDTGHTHGNYSVTGHNHDDRYYTESEMNTKLKDIASSCWYSLTPYYYDDNTKLLYHYYTKIATFDKNINCALRFRSFEDINYAAYGEWVLRLNYNTSFSKCIALAQSTPSNKNFEVYVTSGTSNGNTTYSVWVRSDIEWSSSLEFRIEKNTYNYSVIYTSEWEQLTSAPTNMIATCTNNGLIRISSEGDVKTNTNSQTDTSYMNKFTSDVFVGNLIGNADTADKALKDGNGNNIVNTYATKSSVVQSDWSETGSTMPAYIKNKPAISNYTIEGITGSSVNLMNSQTGQYTTKFIGTGSTIIGQTGNTLGVYNLANGATGTITVGGSSTTQKQADWNTTATTDASFIKNKPTISGSTILGVTGNTVMIQNVKSTFPSTITIGDDTVLNAKSLGSHTVLTRSITSGMCLDTMVPDTYLKLANGTKWGTGYNNAILTISRFNTDKYSSQLGFSQSGIYYRGFGGTLPTTSASWAKVLLSNDTISADTALVYSNDSQQKKLYLVGAATAGVSDYKQLYNDSRIYTSGGCLFATSDERLKDFYEDVDCNLEALKSIPKKYFSWKSDDGKGRQVGTSAQELRKLYPEIVSVDEDGTHSVAYDRLSIVALSAIDKLYDTIKELQTKNEELEKRIKDLENK